MAFPLPNSLLIPLLTAGLMLAGSPSASAADDLGKLVFSDDFERTESQETTDDPGNGWKTNSTARAKGNKQVDLIDGALRIFIHAEADHAVSVTHDFAFVNGAVTMRFKLESDKDSLGLDFADLACKEVHAGHLFKATFAASKVTLADLKTGSMALPFYEANKAGTATKEQKAQAAAKQKHFPVSISTGSWHDLQVVINGTTLTASVDGKEVGSFSSEGIGHPTKRVLRLAVPKVAVVDDVHCFARE